MAKIVLDASAILALLNEESGCEIVAQHLHEAVLSTVNFSEVVTILMDLGIPASEAEHAVQGIIKTIIPFDEQQAMIAAELKKTTKSYGLSLGDRACLALARVEKLPVLTADKAWGKLDKSFKITLVR